MIKSVITFVILVFNIPTYAQADRDDLNQGGIGQTTLNFYDEKRSRPIVLEVWYPTSDSLKDSDKTFSPFKRKFTVRDGKLPSGELPLIFISHGSGGSRFSLEWLAQDLVEAGYVVAAVNHWGNTFDNAIGLEFVKPWERPLDLSFSLTKLLGHKAFKAIIDERRIGALGFSFGGYTVLALAGAAVNYDLLWEFYSSPEGKNEISIPEFPNLWQELQNPELIKMARNVPNLKDTRFKTFFAISPGTARGFNDPAQFREIDRPVFIVGAEADSITPVNSYARKYHQLIARSEYYEFKGKVGHYVMLPEANEEVQRELPVPFKDHPTVNRHEVHERVSELAIRFFNTL